MFSLLSYFAQLIFKVLEEPLCFFCQVQTNFVNLVSQYNINLLVRINRLKNDERKLLGESSHFTNGCNK